MEVGHAPFLVFFIGFGELSSFEWEVTKPQALITIASINVHLKYRILR